ncbi:helix-turn-helix domain-containing protein [Duganella sp. FT80W]|uniref:Helix-turn-helix domain-containing protein n=1 Tax=Duganella guangzhouensis TaxID=2666084 RepID=A0A6I2L6G1_9BURK|nr:helix-turn-helix domain-containing protein [Duganella guangzhouensis]MRW92256.1 helix-turn-helix domain-containing protein [Duganella guangzhouensis]
MHQQFPAPEALRDTIACFWHTRPDSTEFEVIPDGYAEIIFYFGGQCGIFANGAVQQLPSPFLMGLLDQPVRVSAASQLDILGVRCFPWTVFDLLGLAPAKGPHAFEHPITRLHTALAVTMASGGGVAAAVTQLQQYFLQTRGGMPVDNTILKAGAAMLSAHGVLPVSAVAAAAHASVRTLERKFKRSSGHTVKDVAGLMRFEQARNQLWRDPDTNLADLAQALGYTDQSHLNREFKRYSGTTPAAFKSGVRSIISTRPLP